MYNTILLCINLSGNLPMAAGAAILTGRPKEKARIGRAFFESTALIRSDGMSKILLENPGFASPYSALAQILKARAVAAARAFNAMARFGKTVGSEEDWDWLGDPYACEPPPPEESAWRDSEELRRGAEIQMGFEIMRARAARRARPSPARRIRTQARIRARRSPASTRRATTDSGGDDAGGDPEPPRPSLSCGGAL